MNLDFIPKPQAPEPIPSTNHKRGKLQTRPKLGHRPSPEALVPGLHSLGLGEARDGLLYIPEKAAALGTPAPLLVLLHGAGGEALGILQTFKAVADEAGLLLLSIESRKRTWDLVRGGFGEDLIFIDRALEHVLSRYPLRSSQIAIGGFSDGASYALALGIPNGSLFTHVLAFSPGFVAPFEYETLPRIFVSHGTDDRVLAIDRCSRRFVPYLQRTGFDLQYVEFTGGHGIPELIVRESVTWFLAPVNEGTDF